MDNEEFLVRFANAQNGMEKLIDALAYLAVSQRKLELGYPNISASHKTGLNIALENITSCEGARFAENTHLIGHKLSPHASGQELARHEQKVERASAICNEAARKLGKLVRQAVDTAIKAVPMPPQQNANQTRNKCGDNQKFSRNQLTTFSNPRPLIQIRAREGLDGFGDFLFELALGDAHIVIRL